MVCGSIPFADSHMIPNTHLIMGSLTPQAQLSSAVVKWLSVDPCWKIEMGFFKSMADGSGGSNIGDDFLKLLPIGAGGLSLEVAIQQGQVLINSGLASFAPAGCVGSVKAALNLLVNMQCGQAPGVAAQSTDFMQPVFSRLGFLPPSRAKPKMESPVP